MDCPGGFRQEFGRGLEVSGKGWKRDLHFAGVTLCWNDISGSNRKHSCHFGEF